MGVTKALYADKRNSIADICRTLRISRVTLYRYLKARPDEAGPGGGATAAEHGGA